MYLRSTLLPLLLLLPLAIQQPQQPRQPRQPQQPQQQNTIRSHYEAAEARRRAGDRAGAEAEFAAILAEAYARLGKIYSAQKDYKSSVEALEAAARYGPSSADVRTSADVQ